MYLLPVWRIRAKMPEESDFEEIDGSTGVFACERLSGWPIGLGSVKLDRKIRRPEETTNDTNAHELKPKGESRSQDWRK
jgi:hypothetical protein